MRARASIHVAAASIPLLATSTATAALPCEADFDSSGDVGVTDLLSMLGRWGSCTCPQDLNRDGVVGIVDLLDLLASWGPIAFDYGPALPDPEAEQIGLEMQGASGPLLVPPAAFERIDRDLDLVRGLEPDLAGETHSPAWIPSEMLVALVEGAPLDDYLCLNEVYQVVDEELISKSLNLYLLTFAGRLNVPALVTIYQDEAAGEVNFAEPNGLIGGQNFWVPTALEGGVWRWDIDDGFLDCFDGCDCHRLYTFRTDAAGNVVLISYEEQGAPWCDFGP